MDALKTCRFCHSWEGAKIKYGVRHHACPQCLLDKKGRQAILDLPAWKLRNLPWKFIKDNGFEDVVRAEIAREEALR